jgi:hypothetical protein
LSASTLFYPPYIHAPVDAFTRPDSTVQRLMCHLSSIRLLTQLLPPAAELFATTRTTSVARHVDLAEVLAELVTHVAGLWTAREQRALWQDIGEPDSGSAME